MSEKGNGVLVDTSIWIEFFKLHSATGKKLERLIIRNSVFVCGVVLFELLQGVKSEAEKSRITDALSNLKYIEMTNTFWQRAGDLSVLLKKQGLNIPLSDILIATIAREANLQVFTLDRHFEQIPGVKVYDK